MLQSILLIVNALLLSYALYHLVSRGKFKKATTERLRITIITALIIIIAADCILAINEM